MKPCTGCGEVKPLTDYHRASKAHDGRYSKCKTCILAHQAKYRERVAAERVDPAPTDTKTCTGCGEVKPLADYHRKADSRDGRFSRCKVCVLARQAKYAERIVAERVDPAPTDTKTCTGCGETLPLADYHRNAKSIDGHWTRCKPCTLARTKAYYETNREVHLARKKVYHAEKWATDHEYRDRRRAAKTRYHRLLASAKSEPYTRQEIFARDGWVCGICDEPVDPDLRAPDPKSASIDHVVPLSLGGDDTPANVRLAHLGCNVSRGAGVA